MKLHEIIGMNEELQTSILIEKMIPYKKSLLAYYDAHFNCEPVLMITDVTNAIQYAKIVPSNEFSEAIECYIEGMDEGDKEYERETISFNSIMLKDF